MCVGHQEGGVAHANEAHAPDGELTCDVEHTKWVLNPVTFPSVKWF